MAVPTTPASGSSPAYMSPERAEREAAPSGEPSHLLADDAAAQRNGGGDVQLDRLDLPDMPGGGPMNQPRHAASSRARPQPGGRKRPKKARDGSRRSRSRRRQRRSRLGLAPVYDVDGPRVRYGVAWFLVALPAVAVSSITAGLLYALVAAFGASQVVRAWRASSWQSILAAAAVAVVVLAAAWGLEPALYALGASAAVAVVAGLAQPSAGLRSASGRIASVGIMLQAVVPLAVGCGAMVLLRGESEVVAVLLFVMVCAYEVGDFVMGSGAWTVVEGPLAGGLAFILVGFPAILLLLEPFDVVGAWALVAAAATCPVGQWIASAILPRPDAKAPALRRVDTLLLLAPFWVLATATF